MLCGSRTLTGATLVYFIFSPSCYLSSYVRFESSFLIFQIVKMNCETVKEEPCTDVEDEDVPSNGEKAFQCPTCQKTFRSNYFLTNHLRIHTGERPYNCSVCGKTFTTKSHVMRHERTHLEEKPFKCKICQKTYATKYQVTNHEKSHEIKKMEALLDQQGPKKTFNCDICGKFCKSADTLKIHQRFHTGERPFQCDLCGKYFATKTHVKRHKLIHAEVKPYQCTVCGKTFTFNQQLTVHMRTHTGEKPYQCEVCAHPCASLAALRYHKMSHSAEFPYTCSYCGKGFKGKSHLKNHERTHTGEKGPKRIRKKKSKSSANTAQCQCDFCGNVFSNSYNLKLHIMLHTNEKPHQCTICGNSFRIPSSLKEHMMIHSEHRPIKCTGCDKRFIRASDMRSHAKVHSSFREFQCAMCDKGYPTRKNLRYHMMTHTGEKPFKCNTCGVGFRTRRDVRRHQTVHTGKQMYQCDKCDMDFAKRYELQSHLVSVHADELFTPQPVPSEVLVSNKVNDQPKINEPTFFDRLSSSEIGLNLSNKNYDKTAILPSDEPVEESVHNTSWQKPTDSSPYFDANSEDHDMPSHKQKDQEKHGEISNADVSDTAITFGTETNFRGNSNENIYEDTRYEEVDNTSNESDGDLPNDDAPENEGSYEEYNESEISTCKPSDQGGEDYAVNLHDFPPVIKQEVDDEAGDSNTGHLIHCKEPSEATSGTYEHFPDIEVHLKEESSDFESNWEENYVLNEDEKADIENHCQDLSWIKKEDNVTNGDPFEPSDHIVNFRILVPKVERDLADSALKADILLSEFGNILYQCAECKQRFVQQTELADHVSKEHETRFECDKCKLRFTSRSMLLRHRKKHENVSEEQLLNSICQKTCSDFTSTKEQPVEGSGECVYKCTICYENFDREGDLQKHMMVHSNKKPYYCNFCEKGLSTKSQVKYHTMVHSENWPHRCRVCSKGFIDKKDMENHETIHGIGERRFQCGKCGKKFSTSGILKKHEVSHTDEKPFLCKICGKGYKRKDTLRAHERTHGSDPGIICAICGKEFKTRKHFGLHVKIHNEEAAYDCSICGKSFKQKAYRDQHVKIIHTNTFFVCAICGNKFKTQRYLDWHMAKHSDETPFKCNFCDQRFKIKKYVRIHVRKYHLANPCLPKKLQLT